jgi:hypothetical protein
MPRNPVESGMRCCKCISSKYKTQGSCRKRLADLRARPTFLPAETWCGFTLSVRLGFPKRLPRPAGRINIWRWQPVWNLAWYLRRRVVRGIAGRAVRRLLRPFRTNSRFEVVFGFGVRVHYAEIGNHAGFHDAPPEEVTNAERGPTSFSIAPRGKNPLRWLTNPDADYGTPSGNRDGTKDGPRFRAPALP